MDKKEQGRLRKLKLKEGENKRKKLCEEESLKVKCGELIDKEIGGSEDSELEDQLDTPGIPQADIEKEDEEDVSQNIGNYIDNGTEAGSSTRRCKSDILALLV